MARPLTTQVFESTSLHPCNFLSQKVTGKRVWRGGGQAGLYAHGGERKYLNREERRRLLAHFETLPEAKCLAGLLMAWSGARVSEILNLRPCDFQIEAGIVTITTLKRRGMHHVREIPIPPVLMQRLERCFHLLAAQQGPLASRKLWPFCRQTAWRFIKQACAEIGIVGRRASPRGLRHAFGVRAMQQGIQMPVTQRWLGHARLSSTAIYMSVCGPEEIAFARQFWREVPHRTVPVPPRGEFAQAA